MGQPTSTQRDASASASSPSSFSASTQRDTSASSSSSATFLRRELKSKGLQVFLDQQELEPRHIILRQIEAAIEIPMGQPTSTQRHTPASTSASSASSASAPSSASPPASASASASSAFASASSSSSSSALTPNGPYQVFINHRGPDVKQGFASFLYRELKSRGLQVFLDKPELETGYIISSQIQGAIQSASVQIAIFTQNYAESRWCLDELVLMLETTRRDDITERATILPVFYEVEPSHLRRTDTGAYAKAMLKHKGRYDLEIIKKWEKALSYVADISGFELKACNGDEVELVDKVVQRVLKEVPKPPLFVAKYQIGLQQKLEDFEGTVLSRPEGQDLLEAKVVGVVGLGGIGKSTLAREFFNRKRSNYNFSSFLFDVRENARTKSLAHLQKELVQDIKSIDVQIKSWEEGIGILQKNLKSSHALIILDDVDQLHQLNALLPIKHVLDPKSLILITSRDKHVLRTAGIADSSIYQLKGLDPLNSLQLFCSHAFFQPHPPSEFVDLVDGFVKACDGLPLSLQVFGSLLCQQDDRSCWQEQLNGLQTLPHDIQVRLRISYDSLSLEEQQIFLDIACFSIGKDKDEWIRIWGWSGWKGSMGFRNLQNKSLVEVDESNRIRIHDHLRDMGRSIAQDPSLPRRLGGATPKDVYDLLEQSSSSVIEVRGIMMQYRWWSTERDRWNWEEESFSDKVFGISKLQLLQAEGDFVEGILTKLVRSPNLIWLRWYQCPCSSLPSCIPMRHLRFLHVEGNHLQRLWQRESQPPVQLRQLYIRGAPLLQLPNSIENLTNLQSISLQGCTSLEVLPDSIENLRNLQSINLCSCESLKALPNAFGTLTNLREIDLEGCKSMEDLPNSIENLTNLQNIKLEDCTSLEVLPNAIGTSMNLREIDLSGCANLKTLPNFSVSLSNLQKIRLSGCKSLEVLPDSIENLRNLQQINLMCCESLKALPNAFGTLTNLREVDLSRCTSLEVLPDSIENLRNLQSIDLRYCSSLKALPNAFGTLTNLREIDLKGCKSMEDLPNSIENLTNLQNIKLEDCTSLEVLPNAIGNLMNLRKIDLSGCENLKTLPNFSQNLSNLQKISLFNCTSLEVLPDSIENLRNLQSINLRYCSSLKALPNAFGTLTNLRAIDLKGCKSMEDLPNSIENLTNLQNINLEDCKRLKALPNGIWTLMNHRRIDLSGCENLKRLPNFSQNLSNLQEISLRGCKSLQVLPDSIENLTNLQSINLRYCSSLKALPNAFWTLTNLREIDLTACISLEDLPNSIENLTNLQNINLEDCKSLEVLPNAIGTLMNLREIDLSGCVRLKRLPNFSENLSNVQNISLSGCISLEVLPDSIENLTNLQQINLAYCESLKALPNNFGNLTNLKYIDASYASDLQMPPNFLGNLLQLTHLHLSCSRLILSNETLGNSTMLECLDLSGCLRIEVLPLQVLQQRSLKRLNLLSTNIRELPSAPTVCLNNLEVLILGSPLLKVLPPWLGCLKNLKILLLHGCRNLKCLPDSIGQCSQMREMEISKCGIDYLPPAIMQLNNLETLRVRGCPLRELPFKKKVEGEGEPSVKLTESSSDRGMNGLCKMHLYLTEISEVSFPAGVCPNLKKLKIRWCNDLVEVGALPTTLRGLDLRGCGALSKVGGLCGHAQLQRLDIRGCCSLEVEELAGVETVLSMDTLRPILTSLKILKTPLETYDPKEAQMTEAEVEVRMTAKLDSGVLRADLLCSLPY